MAGLGRTGKFRFGAIVAMAATLAGCAPDSGNSLQAVALRRVQVSPSFLVYKHTSPKTVKLTVIESGPEGVVVRAADREPATDRNSQKFRVKPDGTVQMWNRRYEEYFTDLPPEQNR